MSITGTSCHRRGISTILGTLIFVGIIFTAFIPMMLLMSQADMLYDLRKHELGILDQERMDEEVYVYIFPTGEPSNDLTLRVMNRGDFLVKIVNIWINNDFYSEENFMVETMGVNEIILDDGYFTPVPGEPYFIRVTTDRGNIFSSDSGSLYYGSGGIWEGGMFAINFLITYPEAGWYEIEILQGETLLTDPPLQIHKSSSGPAFAFFQVLTVDTYHVKITKNSNQIYDKDVTINWPLGPSVVWIFA